MRPNQALHLTRPATAVLGVRSSLTRAWSLLAWQTGGESSATLKPPTTPDRWSAGHAVFDEVRHRLLGAMKAKDRARECQYGFEESCCQALYNATDPPDPFDPGSAFFV